MIGTVSPLDPRAEGHGSSGGVTSSTWRRTPRWARRLVVCAVVLVLLLVTLTVVRVTWRDVYSIESGSMRPTLAPGQKILVDRTVSGHGIGHGDVVVFDGRGSFSRYSSSSPGDDLLRALHLRGRGDVYVKRVIGLPGDRVSCAGHGAPLKINGSVLEEDYLHQGDEPSGARFDVVVPDGRLWLMGDHRSVSVDSRNLMGSAGGGMVSEDRVLGRVSDVLWPLDARGRVPQAGEE